MGKKDTQEYRRKAHEALYPLWHACNELLISSGEGVSFTGGNMVEHDTPDGATIRRIGDIVMVEADFVVFTKSGAEVLEEVTITFPEDIRDLADADIGRYVGTERGVTAGSVGVRNYPLYARSMLSLVTGSLVDG